MSTNRSTVISLPTFLSSLSLSLSSALRSLISRDGLHRCHRQQRCCSRQRTDEICREQRERKNEREREGKRKRLFFYPFFCRFCFSSDNSVCVCVCFQAFLCNVTCFYSSHRRSITPLKSLCLPSFSSLARFDSVFRFLLIGKNTAEMIACARVCVCVCVCGDCEIRKPVIANTQNPFFVTHTLSPFVFLSALTII